MKKFLSTAMIALAPLAAQAGLIQNGSFEDLGGQTFQKANWGYFTSVTGWTGVDHLEIHRGINRGPFAKAVDGNYYAELNAHPRQTGSFEFFQTFDTVAGESYQLDFYAQKRKNDDGDFSFSVGNIVNQVINSHQNNTWTAFSFLFTATANTSTLGFLSGQGGHDTTGHYLDNISVTALRGNGGNGGGQASVSEPGVMVLLSGGLLALGVARRRSAKG